MSTMQQDARGVWQEVPDPIDWLRATVAHSRGSLSGALREWAETSPRDAGRNRQTWSALTDVMPYRPHHRGHDQWIRVTVSDLLTVAAERGATIHPDHER